MNRDKIQLIIESVRPKQWSKNFLLFAGIIFSRNLYNVTLLLKVSLGFCLFCLLSGGVYLLNDVIDKEYDAKNPLKARRPIASERLEIRSALRASIILLSFSIGASFLLDIHFGCVTSIYLAVQIIYSLWLKKLIILDLFAVALSYLLRVVGGALLVGVKISSWLLACTILLAFFLIISKRRHELIYLADDAYLSRQALGEYNTVLLDQMISIVTSSAIVCYCLYTMSEKTIKQAGTENLIFTVPFVIYGIFRYLYLVYKKSEGGHPEEALLKDKPLLINIMIWVGLVILFLYFL